MQPVQTTYIANVLAARINRASGWIYTIAGFCALNAILDFSNSRWLSLFGLGITTFVNFVDVFASHYGAAAKMAALALGVAITAFCAILGYKASRGNVWAFILVLVCYSLDACLFLFPLSYETRQALISFAVHGYVLFRLFPGITASRELAAEIARVRNPATYLPRSGPEKPEQPVVWPPPPSAWPNQPIQQSPRPTQPQGEIPVQPPVPRMGRMPESAEEAD